MRSSLLLPLLCALPVGCTNALLEPRPLSETSLDDRLQIRGSVCTSAPSATDFPVKVEFLVDKSGSMCVSDGPGSQNGNGFCETIGTELARQGITTPGRVRAMLDLQSRLSSQSNVYMAIDPWESKISSEYPRPPSATEPNFIPASDGALPQRIRDLQADLGKGTDYEGALGRAYARIEADIQQTLRSSAAQLPRTKYVVILLTDGTPYPRCTTNDNMAADQYATVDHPERIWKDNPASFCNAKDEDNPNRDMPFYVRGTDRN